MQKIQNLNISLLRRSRYLLAQKPQYLLAGVQICLILYAKLLFWRAGAEDDPAAFWWIYQPTAVLLNWLTSFWYPSGWELSYDGFVCNFTLLGRQSSSAALSGCAASGLFLTLLLLGLWFFLLWPQSRFIQKRKYPAQRWHQALLGLFSSYLVSYLLLLCYNAYLIFGSAALSRRVTLFYFTHPNWPRLPYQEVVKFGFLFLAALLFWMLCRSKKVKPPSTAQQ